MQQIKEQIAAELRAAYKVLAERNGRIRSSDIDTTKLIIVARLGVGSGLDAFTEVAGLPIVFTDTALSLPYYAYAMRDPSLYEAQWLAALAEVQENPELYKEAQ